MLPLSGAQRPSRGGSCRLRHAPESRARRPGRPHGRRRGSGASRSLLSVTSQQGRLWFVPTPGTGGRVYGLLVLLTLRPPGPPGSTLAQAPASGAGPGLCPAAPKLPALTAASPSLCAASARSRSAEVLSRPRGVTPRFLSALWEGGRARSRVGFTPRDPVLLSSLSWHQARC